MCKYEKGYQPMGLESFIKACPTCKNQGSKLCRKCKMEVESGYEPIEPHVGNQIGYEERAKVYTNAFVTYGERAQMVVALEELSECQKEICKFMRGIGNAGNLAEEIADATIMLEQMRMIFGVNDLVCQKMDQKIQRLDERLKR